MGEIMKFARLGEANWIVVLFATLLAWPSSGAIDNTSESFTGPSGTKVLNNSFLLRSDEDCKFGTTCNLEIYYLHGDEKRLLFDEPITVESIDSSSEKMTGVSNRRCDSDMQIDRIEFNAKELSMSLEREYSVPTDKFCATEHANITPRAIVFEQLAEENWYFSIAR